jgi:hypothetical protein
MANALTNNYRVGLLTIGSAYGWDATHTYKAIALTSLVTSAESAHSTVAEVTAALGAAVMSTRSDAISGVSVGSTGVANCNAVVFNGLNSAGVTVKAIYIYREINAGDDTQNPLICYIDTMSPSGGFIAAGGQTTITPSGAGFFRV